MRALLLVRCVCRQRHHTFSGRCAGAERKPAFFEVLAADTRVHCQTLYHADAAIGKYELLVSGTNMVLDSSTNTGPCSVTKKGRTQRMDITKIVDDLRVSSRN